MFDEFKDHFIKVFKSIVPKSQVEIELVDCGIKQASYSDSVSDHRGIRLLPTFDGLKPQSATTNKDGIMMTLSPGQRTILSICILVALQKCSPSPFYCFDEIDADLDSTTISAITKLIGSISQSSQVFITTFRPESLAIKKAKVFRVDMIEGQSRTEIITIENAKDLLTRK